MNARHLAFFVIAILALIAVGCAPPRSNPPSGSSYTFVNSSIEGRVTVLQVVEEKRGDLAGAQIMLYNNSKTPVTVYVRSRYFDAAGREVNSTFSQWTPIVIAGRSSRPHSAVAPDRSVTRISFEIDAAKTEPQPSPRK